MLMLKTNIIEYIKLLNLGVGDMTKILYHDTCNFMPR